MTEQDKRIDSLEDAVGELKTIVDSKLHLDEESKKTLNKLLSFAIFLTKAFEYGKVIGTTLMACIGAWMVLDKFLDGIGK